MIRPPIPVMAQCLAGPSRIARPVLPRLPLPVRSIHLGRTSTSAVNLEYKSSLCNARASTSSVVSSLADARHVVWSGAGLGTISSRSTRLPYPFHHSLSRSHARDEVRLYHTCTSPHFGNMNTCSSRSRWTYTPHPHALARSHPHSFAPLHAQSRAYSAERLSFPTMARVPWWRPLHLVVYFIPIFTFCLGIWQVRRLRWKLDLIDEVQHALDREPMLLPSRVNTSVWEEFAFRRVLVRGRWAKAGPGLLLGPKTMLGVPGYDLILPFVRSGSARSGERGEQGEEPTTILVNRGFITKTRAEAIREGREVASGLEGSDEYTDRQAALATELEAGPGGGYHPDLPNGGLGDISLRPSGPRQTSEASDPGDEVLLCMIPKKWREGQGRWNLNNRPEKGEWFWVDLKAMTAFVKEQWAGASTTSTAGGSGLGLAGRERANMGELQDVLVEVIDTEDIPPTLLMQKGIPVGRARTVELRNMHGTYAATWFTLSAMTAIMMALVYRKSKKRILPDSRVLRSRM